MEEDNNKSNSEGHQTEGMDLTTSGTKQTDVKSPENPQENGEKMDVDKDATDMEPTTSNAQEQAGPAQKKKRKKTRKIKRSDEYPKFYRNAYVRYCDIFRPKISELNPSLDSVEITKLVASNWYSLPKEEKQPYLEEARIDKERFERQLKEYKSNNPEESFERPSKKQKLSKEGSVKDLKKEVPIASSSPKPSSVNTQMPSTSTSIPVNSIAQPSTSHAANERINEDLLKVLLGQNCEIPIFTDTFLEHNKVIESEVKTLRKNNIDLELQNSVLMKHIENMENGVIKIESEIAQNRKKNMALEVYLTKLRVILSANLNSLQIPGWKSGATVENIDKFMSDLSKSSTTTLNKARDVIKKIDLQI